MAQPMHTWKNILQRIKALEDKPTHIFPTICSSVANLENTTLKFEATFYSSGLD